MKLLLAEDERELNRALSVMLSKNGYTVDAVEDGRTALEFLLTGDYDGAVLDIMMPQMDGLEVLSRVRAAGKQLPVLLLTAKTEVDDRVRGLDTGADDYLTKPFAVKELLARLRAILRRGEERIVEKLSFGNVSLSPATYELVGPAGASRLTSKEYQLMELFLRNSNILLSTQHCMEKVWGFDSDAEINVVWVGISALRKKLLSIGADIEICANRGVGYTLKRRDLND